MSHDSEAEVVLDRVDLLVVSMRKCVVDMGDDSLDVRGAILGHVRPDGVEYFPEIRDRLYDRGGRVPSEKDTRFGDHRPGCQCTYNLFELSPHAEKGKGRTAIASAHEYPRGLSWCKMGAVRHRQLYIFREVNEIVDRLLNGVYSEALVGEIWVRV